MMNTPPLHFSVVGIPLSRPEIVDFLMPPQREAKGAWLYTVGQRPLPAAESAWIRQLQANPAPTVDDLLAIDDPHGHLTFTRTSRLVPVEFLAESNFLTRDLGGWVANYFATIGLPADVPDDPILRHRETLQEYGENIRYFGANSAQVAARLESEMGLTVNEVVQAFCCLHKVRRRLLLSEPVPHVGRIAYVERVYKEIATGNNFASVGKRPLPDLLLYDELMGQLVLLELTRRSAMAWGDERETAVIGDWQQAQTAKNGLLLMLKGEYLVGRHRRSAILIAPELGVVIKQPGPEPYHEIGLGAKFEMGRKENWPYITNDGSLVTSRGRLRLILEENLVPRISDAFGYSMQFSSFFGLTIETYVHGPTVQDVVLGDHSRLNEELYEEIVLHQQTCELMGIENGDWHAPNFVVRASDGEIVHVDWGAARPLRDDEYTPKAIQSRVNQVNNMAFSFKDEGLAARLMQLHHDLTTDETRMTNLRQRAQKLAAGH